MNVQDLLGLDSKAEVDALVKELEARFGLLPTNAGLLPREAYLHMAGALVLLCGMQQLMVAREGHYGIPPAVLATMQAMGNLAVSLRRPAAPPAKLITVVQS